MNITARLIEPDKGNRFAMTLEAVQEMAELYRDQVIKILPRLGADEEDAVGTGVIRLDDDGNLLLDANIPDVDAIFTRKTQEGEVRFLVAPSVGWPAPSVRQASVRQASVHYDPDADFLEVVLDERPGIMKQTTDPRVMVNEDLDGNLIGIAVEHVREPAAERAEAAGVRGTNDDGEQT